MCVREPASTRPSVSEMVPTLVGLHRAQDGVDEHRADEVDRARSTGSSGTRRCGAAGASRSPSPRRRPAGPRNAASSSQVAAMPARPKSSEGKPEECVRLRPRVGERMHQQEIERTQLHPTRPDGRLVEVLRLVDRVDLVLPEVEREEPGKAEQQGNAEHPPCLGGQPQGRGAGAQRPASAVDSVGSVTAWIDSNVSPGDASTSTSPAGVTSITARSVMIRCTHRRPVSGSVHCVQDLGRAVLGAVLHDHHHPPRAGHQVHRAAHALHHLARHHPVGEVALRATPAARPGS